jgi:hypothetical protein
MTGAFRFSNHQLTGKSSHWRKNFLSRTCAQPGFLGFFLSYALDLAAL